MIPLHEKWVWAMRTTRILYLIAWLLVILSCVQSSAGDTRVVCYYTNWSVYRPGTAKFSPQNINPYLCTHLIYAFGGFTKENALKPFDKYQDIEKGGYAKFTGLKTYNKNLKTMLAIGGWNEGSSRFSPMVANAERRKMFIKNSIKFLRQNNFDGLDLDWEYPNFRDGGKPRDKDNYAQLVQEFREEFDKESKATNRPRLLLTMAVPAGIEYINKGYDVPKLMRYLDWMNLLTYDYHSAYEPSVNHHSPLYSLEEENEYNYDTELNIDYTIKHYLKNGAERSKLVLGIPTYGRSYTLFNPNATDMGSPADGPGEMGDATRENGYLAYYEICDNIKTKNWKVVQPNPDALGPYAYQDNQWVSYDDIDIAKKKAKYTAEQGLGGIMFWAIDTDDFRGACHGKPFPLIEAAKEALLAASRNVNQITSDKSESKSTPRRKTINRGGGPQSQSIDDSDTAVRRRPSNRFAVNKNSEKTRTSPSTSTASRRRKNRLRNNQRSTTTTTVTPSSTTLTTPSYTTPSPPTTPDPGSDFKCEDEGFFPHPRDCKKYFWCLSGPSELGIVAHQFTCPAGLYFNKAADSCDYTQNVLCRKPKATTTTTTTSTTTTTTARPANSIFTTRRTPAPITAATSKTTFVSTTTAEPELEDEYEEYEDELEDDIAESEDPRVIKELIMLIKKAGGIEELEKQFQIEEKGSSVNSETTTKLSRNLYQRVLNRANNGKDVESTKPASKSFSRGPQFNYQSIRRGNSDEKENDKSRPAYTTINRNRPTTEAAEEELEEDEEDEPVDEEKPQRKYTSINRFSKSGEPVNARSPIGSSTTNRPEYVTLRRRPTTTEESATSKYKTISRGSTSTTETASEPETEEVIKPVVEEVQEDVVETEPVPQEPSSSSQPSTEPAPKELPEPAPSSSSAVPTVRTSSVRPTTTETTTSTSTSTSTTTARPVRIKTFNFKRPVESPSSVAPPPAAVKSNEKNTPVRSRTIYNRPSNRTRQLSRTKVVNKPEVLQKENEASAVPTVQLDVRMAVPINLQNVQKDSEGHQKPEDVIDIKFDKPQSIPSTQLVRTYDRYSTVRNKFGYIENKYGLIGDVPANSKVILHNSGKIQCLDQGNFPHPIYCNKFISCINIDNGDLIGWEYTCPSQLTFDPVGGLCNWPTSARCGLV